METGGQGPNGISAAGLCFRGWSGKTLKFVRLWI